MLHRSFLLLCLPVMAFSQDRPVEYTYRVVREYPHDASAFTQGLAFQDGILYEGTGLQGQSSLRKVRLETGEVIQKVDLPREFFGEGIAVLKDEIVQVTWQSQVGFVYHRDNLNLLRRFKYPGEGWGLATDGQDLFLSDGTSDIRVLDGATLTEKRRITVRDGNAPVILLNELEIVDGEIFANVWQTERIARISPTTGKVTGWIDLAGLTPAGVQLELGAVLNGIAYDAAGKRLFVTGKLWPKIFEIELIPKRTR
jgi:glutaminyl-peptide cyclotransferase